MFTEVLRIKPQIDRGDLQKMERTLTQRFSRVAKGFGRGLNLAMKGTVLGMSVALLNRLLNPIKELEERMKSLLGMGSDVEERAAQLGTSPGELLRAEAAAAREGVSKEQFAHILESYATAVRTAEKELKSGGEISASTESVKQFAGDQNIVESFGRFLQGLALRPEVRLAAEENVLGGVQRGSAKRLLDKGLDFSGIGPADESSKAAGDLAALERQRMFDEARNRVNAIVAGAEAITAKQVTAMGVSEGKEEQSDIRAIGGRLSGQQAAMADLRVIREKLESVSDLAVKGLAFLSRGVAWLESDGRKTMETIRRWLPGLGRQ